MLQESLKRELDSITMPKESSTEDVLEVEKLLTRLEEEQGIGDGSIGIIPIVETARGVINAYSIASASRWVIALSFGAVDYMRDMGVSRRSKEGLELYMPRYMVAISARAAGVLSIDTVYTDILDLEGLVREAEVARALGFKGKNAIHPKQIEPINRVFSPTREELEEAKKMVEAFESALKRGLGAISLDGRMIDRPVFEQAKELLELARQISEREKASRESISISELMKGGFHE